VRIFAFPPLWKHISHEGTSGSRVGFFFAALEKYYHFLQASRHQRKLNCDTPKEIHNREDHNRLTKNKSPRKYLKN